MGGIFSSFRKPEETDYEKILSNLDNEIKKAELRLSEIKVRERRVVLVWLFYSTLAYAVYLVGFFFFFSQDDGLWDDWIIKVLPIPLTPVAIFMINRLVGMFYKRKQTSEETQLGILRAEQKQRIEELKKKTSYYTTKSLVERYDPSATPRQGRGSQPGQPGQPGQPDQRSAQSQQKGPGAPVPGGQYPTTMQKMPDGSMARVPINPAAANLQQRPPQPGSPLPYPRPQLQPGPNGATAPILQQYPPAGPPVPTEKHWYEKLVDVLVGDDGPETKYALICNNCFAHNGLVLPQEVDDIQYTCPKCHHFNPSRRSRNLVSIPRINEPGSGANSRSSSRALSRSPSGVRNLSQQRGRSPTLRSREGYEALERPRSTSGNERVDGYRVGTPDAVEEAEREKGTEEEGKEEEEEEMDEGTEAGDVSEEGSIAGRVRRRRNPKST